MLWFSSVFSALEDHTGQPSAQTKCGIDRGERTYLTLNRNNKNPLSRNRLASPAANAVEIFANGLC